MSAQLSDDLLFEPRVPPEWRGLVDVVASLWDTMNSEAPQPDRRTEAEALRARWLRDAHRLAERLPPELASHAPQHRLWFTEAVLLWLHFGRVAGTPRLDTLRTKSLRSYPVDLASGDAERPRIRAGLARAFGWTDAELDALEARIERLISNLEVKHAVSAAFVEAALRGGEAGLQERAAELMRQVYGPKVPVRAGDVDLVVSASAVYFCLAYRGDEFRGPGFAQRPRDEQAALNDFLRRLRNENTFRTARFPAFGLFDPALLDPGFVDALQAGAEARLGHGLKREVLVETFATMTMILPTELADQYLVHDAWGHGWQEALCEFEWLYGDVVHLQDPLEFDTGARAGRPPGERLGDAFVARDGRTELDEQRLIDVVEADLRHRILAAGNTFVSEVLADLVEHKYVRRLNPTEDAFPTSSLLPLSCLKVDLSLGDSRAYGRAWSAPYRRLIGRKAVRARFIAQLEAAGRPRKGLRAAVERAASVIEERFAGALATEFEHPPQDGPVEAGVVQRLGLCALALDAEVTDFVERGEAELASARASAPDLPRWQVPEACIDLLVVALAWFYEQERSAYIWHLDELLREALGPTCERFGAALRSLP